MPAGRHHRADEDVHSISNAAEAHSTDMHRRMIQYGLAMGIRMVCLILLFVVDGWFKLLMVAGAVFLPWIAVVIANGSDQVQISSDSLLDTTPYIELEGPTANAPAEASGGSDGPGGVQDGNDGDGPVILQGELVLDEDGPDEQEKRA